MKDSFNDEIVNSTSDTTALLKDRDAYEYSITQLSEIIKLDNHYKQEGSNAIISSTIIVEKFGGVESIAQGLKTNLETGISSNDFQDRKENFGKNFFPPPKIKTLGELVAENFDDPINVILLLAAIVSVVIGLIKSGFPEGLIEGTSIMIALMIIIVVNSANNWVS